MDNATYLRTFQSHINAIDHLNGDFGIHMLYIQAHIQETRGDINDVATCKRTKIAVCEEFVAKCFLLKSDPRRYALLIAMIQNDYISGQDKYPTTLSRAYDLLVNYVNPHNGSARPRNVVSSRA
jgi:hypothetical protein